jgi:hypothetical protein
MTAFATRFVFEAAFLVAKTFNRSIKHREASDTTCLELPCEINENSQGFKDACAAVSNAMFMVSPVDQAYCLYSAQSLLMNVCEMPSPISEGLIVNLWKILLIKAEVPEIELILEFIGKWRALISPALVRSWEFARRAFAEVFGAT